MKDKYLQVRVSEEDRQALNELAEKLDKPASQIVRESVREKIAVELEKKEATTAPV